MKKRWLALYVENNVGVLAKIAGLFAGKSYNLDSLTVGTAENPSISRITISLACDERLFEQIKKQLNRCIEIIRVIDLTEKDITNKEILFIKIKDCAVHDLEKLTQIATLYGATLTNYGQNCILLEVTSPSSQNDQFIAAVNQFTIIEVVRSGSAAIENN